MVKEYWVTRNIADSLPVGILVMDGKGKIVQCNTAASRILDISQYQQPEQTSTGYAQHAIRLDGTRYRDDENPFLVTLKTGDPLRNAIMGLPHKDGTHVWVSLTTSLIQDSQDDASGAVLAVLEDVTDRIRRPRNLEALLNALPSPVFCCDNRGVFQGCNDAFTEFTALTAEQILGKSLREFWPQHIADVFCEAASLRDPSGHTKTEAFHVCDRDGKTREILMNRSVWLDATKQPAGWLGSITELTEGEHSPGLSDTILGSLDISIAVVDRKGIITAVNEGWRRYAEAGMASRQLQDGVGIDYFAVLRSLIQASTDQDAKQVLEGFENVLAGRIPGFSYEYHCVIPGGDALWYQLRATPLRTRAGGLVISHIDVTQQHFAQSEALLLKDELEDRVNQRTAALAAVNLDLRTQQLRLNFLKGLAEHSNLADDLNDVLRYCVQELCQMADWSFGQVYFVSPAANELVPSPLRYSGRPTQATAPDGYATAKTLNLDAGLLGSAWGLQRAMWVRRDEPSGEVQLRERFGDTGICWALALPVLVGRHVCAVIEFASTNLNMLGRDGNAFVDQLFALLQVIAERKETERELRKLALIAQHTDNAIIICDGKGLIEWVNPGYTKITGYTLQESQGRRPGEFLQGPLTDPNAIAFLREAVRKGEKVECEILNYSKEGRPYWLELAIYPARNSAGVLEHFVAIERDISERRGLMSALEQSKAAAESANRAKGDFLANMSHEIRTPMNAIIGMTELALATDLNSKQRSYVSKINSASDSLLHIINDILDFSKIEAGMLQMEHLEFNLDEVLHNLGVLLSRQAEAKGIELIFEVRPEVPLNLIGDPLRLGQVLINLVGNAIKFSNQGSVLVRVGASAQNSGAATLRFTVIDQGIGMSAQEMEGLFSAFNQADSSTTRRYGGTGLGLAICKRLVQLMGGEIHVKSTLDQGSTFEFTVQLEKAGASENRIQQYKKALTPYNSRPVLVIDDKELTCKIVTAQLAQLGLTAECHLSGASALRAVERDDAPGYLFVMCDLSMPDQDGVETIRQLRRHYTAKKMPPPPILIMTASSHAEALELIDFPLDGFLAKPSSPSAICAEIAPWLGLTDLFRTFQNSSHFAPDTTKFKGFEVLLVEDTDLNKEVMVDVLRSANIVVQVANNGAEALRLLQDHTPDCVLMDCQMPIMDGLEATRRIRENPAWRKLPVIALTANAMASDRQRCLDAGMNDHIAKPIRQGELFATLDRWLTPRSQGAWQRSEVTPHAEGLRVPVLDGIQTATGLEVVGGNVPLYLRLLRKFRDHHLVGFVSTFEEKIGKGDWQGAARLVHTVKGAAMTVGSDELGSALKLLEATCTEESPSVQTVLSPVSNQIARMIAELGKVPDETRRTVAPSPQRQLQVCDDLARLLEERDTAASAYMSEFNEVFAHHPRQHLINQIRSAVNCYDHLTALAELRKLQQTFQAGMP